MAKKQRRRETRQMRSPWFYLTGSLGTLLIGIGILLLLVFKGKDLVETGLGDKVYYVLLICMALAAAGFLFGVLRSYALYKGKVLSGVLELGGPVVLFVLVLVLGFKLLPVNDEPFTFTVRLRDTAGAAVLKGEGKLRVILDEDTRTMDIDDEGKAVFTGIPASFKNKSVPVELDARGWQFVKTGPDGGEKLRVRCSPAKKSADLVIERDDSLAVLNFSVTGGDGQPVSGAVVLVEGRRMGETDAYGMLSVSLPKSLQKPEVDTAVQKEGFINWEKKSYPATGAPVKVVLESRGQ